MKKTYEKHSTEACTVESQHGKWYNYQHINYNIHPIQDTYEA